MRVHELAKQWDIETKDLIAGLERIGIRGKRSQSSLTDDEVQQASQELKPGDKPSVTIGEERVVTADTGQQVVERRVGTKVIRRRAAAPETEMAQTEPLQTFGVQTEVLQTFAAPEPPPAESVDQVVFTPLAEPAEAPVLEEEAEPSGPPIESPPPRAGGGADDTVGAVYCGRAGCDGGS
jgi:translation initiation factor IF-2